MWKPSPRPLVYLDQWALKKFSGDAQLRNRMLRVLQRGTLLFSLMNLMEIARTKGATFENIVSFLDDVGDRWAPVSLNTTEVGLRERAGILEPWRDPAIEQWVVHAPGVDGKLSKLIRRGQEPWAEDANKRWEKEEAARIGAMISDGRDRIRKRTLNLDSRGTVLERYVRSSLKTDRTQIDDLFHTTVVDHADVVFLDRPTKHELLKGRSTRAKVFWEKEIDAAFQHLETLAAA